MNFPAKTPSKTQRPTKSCPMKTPSPSKLDTPQREAVELLLSVGAPQEALDNASLVREIGAYKIIASSLRGAPKKAKMQLFRPKKRRWGYIAMICKKINLNCKRLFNKKKSVTICKESRKKQESEVIAFLEREENSYRLPDKKNPNVFAWTNTMSALYQAFKEENPRSTMSHSKFCSFRPKRIKLIQATDRQQCLCQTCENARLMLIAIGWFGLV